MRIYEKVEHPKVRMSDGATGPCRVVRVDQLRNGTLRVTVYRKNGAWIGAAYQHADTWFSEEEAAAVVKYLNTPKSWWGRSDYLDRHYIARR